MKEKKVCFVLPYFDIKASSNVLHLLDLVDNAAKNLKINLYIENCISKPEVKNINCIWQENTRFILFRIIKRFFLFLVLRLKGYKYFYVHGSYFSSLIASLICFFSGGKSFFWHCEKFVNYGKDIEKGILNFLKWRFLHDFPLRLSLFLANFLVTGSERIKDEYCKIFRLSKKKVKIMPNAIDISKFKTKMNQEDCRKELSLPLNTNIILFVHWLAPRKGADLLPKIIEKTIARIGKVTFLIVGRGPLKNRIKEQIKLDGHEKYVIFADEVQNIKMPLYYKAADIFILPSRQEGFPRVILEAMACDLPFVTTDAGAIPDIISVKQKKFMVRPSDIDNFAEKIIEMVLIDETERKNLIDVGEKIVQDYSIDSIIKRFVLLFD